MFSVNYDKLAVAINELQKRTNSLYSLLDTYESNIASVICSDISFSGESADAIKLYFNNTHTTIITLIKKALVRYNQSLNIFYNDFLSIDNGLHPIINEADLYSVINTFDISKRNVIDNYHNNFVSNCNVVSDLVNISIPQVTSVELCIERIQDSTKKLIASINSCISNHNNDLNDILQLLFQVDSLIHNQRSAERINPSVCPLGLNFTNININELSNTIDVISQNIVNDLDKSLAAQDNIENLYERWKEEAQNARVEKGLVLIIDSALILGCVVLEVCSLGSSTPVTVVVLSGIFAGCSSAYAVSNIIEGASELSYGLNGDITTAALNPIRDTIFCGNQELYDIWGEANVIATSCTTAIGKSISAETVKGLTEGTITEVEGLSSKETAKIVLQEIAKTEAKVSMDKVFTPYVIEPLSEKMTGTDETGKIVSTIIKEATNSWIGEKGIAQGMFDTAIETSKTNVEICLDHTELSDTTKKIINIGVGEIGDTLSESDLPIITKEIDSSELSVNEKAEWKGLSKETPYAPTVSRQNISDDVSYNESDDIVIPSVEEINRDIVIENMNSEIKKSEKISGIEDSLNKIEGFVPESKEKGKEENSNPIINILTED